MVQILLQFGVFFAIIFVAGYLLPAAQFHFLYRSRPDRIQAAQPRPGQIARELRLSVITVIIFAAGSTALYQMYLAGLTNIYWSRHDYFPGYGILSVLLCLILHDTFFYWSHRLMHLPMFFKHTHAGHHKSVTPTPWALFAFQPAEAVIQFIGIALLVIFLPLHPLALLAFLAIDTFINTAGHCGYEITPKWLARQQFFSIFSTVTSHDAHHTNMRVNFGSFFNVWDRLCGTYNRGAVKDELVEESGHQRQLHGSAVARSHARERQGARMASERHGASHG